jgi:hypothetical protein
MYAVKCRAMKIVVFMFVVLHSISTSSFYISSSCLCDAAPRDGKARWRARTLGPAGRKTRLTASAASPEERSALRRRFFMFFLKSASVNSCLCAGIYIVFSTIVPQCRLLIVSRKTEKQELNSMKHGPSWEAGSRSAVQDNTRH